jgi:hypothetical protein
LNLKILSLISGLAAALYFLWPILVMGIKMYVYQLVIEYGFYFLFILAGAGFYFWRRLKN